MNKHQVNTILRDMIQETMQISKLRLDEKSITIIEKQKSLFLEIQDLFISTNPDKMEVFRLGRLIIQLSYLIDEKIPDVIH